MSKDLLLEIGTEEVPAHVMPNLLTDLKRLAGDLLAEHRLAYESLRTIGTPRRSALLVTGLAERQEDVSTETRGPSVAIAFDAEGNPTKAGAGFARGQGIEPSALIQRDGYVYASVYEKGAETAQLLAELLPELIRAIPLPNSMRWGDLDFRFIRPIRWIVALYGTEVVPFTLANVTSGNKSRGHRTLAPADFVIASPADYEAACEKAYIIVDPERRRAMICEQIAETAKACGGTAEITPDLLEEVLYLVEYPTALSGAFEEKYLALPAETVITPMRDHQRYFPVKAADGSLLPVFITVRNGGREHLDVVAHGTERVLRARLADAQFFFDEDRKKPLAEHREKLKTVVFQQGLGSMYEKTERLMGLVTAIVEDLAPDDAAYETMAEDARRAAELSKADLVTGMVTEFTELQGIMGREYALLDGEKPEVARAIDEQYMPRFAGDELPQSALGFALSVADKIDNIVGTFSRGKIPTGSQDPFALRRQALGLVLMLIEHESSLLLSDLVDEASDLYDLDASLCQKMQVYVADFIRLRLKNVLTERGVRYDVQEAVLADVDFVADVPVRAAYVERLLASDGADALVQSFVRVGNIARMTETGVVDAALFAADEEGALLSAYENAVAARDDGTDTMAAEQSLAKAIDAFFDAVMVMDKDERIKLNRLRLLKAIDNYLLETADYSKIVLN
ncbi:glycine--tRNA ligase subunit beta [Selenomonas sp. oral taxon 138]|uniref:glycine--tRNA ligase subunit beta n=1 Tax=Selenomonas sp. oral taxon 138 TaxID=712532 RepID=UPI0002A3C5C8|nr:glycine--tRNA ligase subunit beta [Selenomonas sp. oral taxon 138]EKX95156.1 glycine--tRNA ligase, beta subunit [Selenomonas sp. oral taxon 138 str. F0429]